MNEKQFLVKCLLDLGEALLLAGAEINRVEDSLSRVAKNYGALKVDVFVLTSVINLTVTFNDESLETQTRRLNTQGVTNFNKIEELNALCRNCANMNICEFDKNLHENAGKTPKKLYQYLGSFLAAGGFALFFGGNVFDGLLAGVFALLICFLQVHYSKVCPNKVFFHLTTSLFIGIGIFTCTWLMPNFNSDMILIGDIMILIY